MIQRQIMASLGLTRRPNVPRRRDRNVTDADIERLLPLLRQGDDSHNDSDATSARLYVVKRIHALLPTCELQRQQRPHQLCRTGERQYIQQVVKEYERPHHRLVTPHGGEWIRPTLISI